MQVKYRNFAFYRLFSLLEFVGIVFVSSLYDSFTSSHVIAKLSIILAKHSLFLKLHVARF